MPKLTGLRDISPLEVKKDRPKVLDRPKVPQKYVANAVRQSYNF